MGRRVKLYYDNTSDKQLRDIVTALENGAVIIYPTDSCYALGCSLNNIKAIGEVKRIKGKDSDDLSLICHDLSHLSDYAKVDNNIFKILKRNTPGTFTFILNASNNVPNKFLERKSSVGIRVPDDSIARDITAMLGMPLVSTSLNMTNIEDEDSGNADLIWELYSSKVDIFVDAGDKENQLSTVVDLSHGEIEILREGAHELDL